MCVCVAKKSLCRSWGSQKAEAAILPNIRHMKVVRLSALGTGRFKPQEIFLVLIYFTCWLDPMHRAVPSFHHFITSRNNLTFYLNFTNIRRNVTIQTETGRFLKNIFRSFTDLIILLFTNCRKRILQSDKIDGRIILKWIFRKWEEGTWYGLNWLRIGTGGGHL